MKALLNWRYYILLVLGMVAMHGVFSEPLEDSKTWFLDFFLSKGIGIGAGYVWYRLYAYWETRNLIPELQALCIEEDELD